MRKYSLYKTFFFFLFLSLFSLFCFSDTNHVIQNGETLYSLQKKYKVSVEEIKKANNITDVTKIKVGQKIIIPSTEAVVSKEAAATKPSNGVYVAKKGDTLYSIARTNNCKFSEILILNNFDKDYKVKIGEKILIPQNLDSSNLNTTQNKDKTKNDLAINNSSKDTTNVVIVDPRKYSSSSTNQNSIWPIKVKKMAYLTGKLYGVVLIGDKGSVVESVTSGTILSASPFRGYGNVVMIRNQSGYVYAYCGVDSLSVAVGDDVSFGTQLGELGFDSVANRSQMIFVVYKNDKAIDPAKAPRG